MRPADCDYCRPKPLRRPARAARPHDQIVARFAARFDSDCDECGEVMFTGNPICRTVDGDYIHEDCSESWPGVG
jgi:hypothetical protein